MSPIPKRKTVLTDTDKQVMRRRLDGARLPAGLVERLGLLAHAVEAERVEPLGVREGLFVAADGVGGDLDRDAGGDALAVGEGDGFEDFAAERGLG